MTIVAAMIDSREPAWVQRLAFGKALTTVTKLDHGDLLATTDDGALIAVERKTVSDLLGSVRDGRIWPQLAGMRAQTPWCYLVVCGHMQPSADGNVVTDRGSNGWSWASIQGVLIKAQELGAVVVQVATDDDYEQTVMRLSSRSHDATIVIEPPRTPSVLSEAERILTALPGVGLEKVTALLDYAATPAWVLAFLCDLETDDKVPGIGPGTKKRIRKALGLKDNESLWLQANEKENHGTDKSFGGDATAAVDAANVADDRTDSTGDARGPLFRGEQPRTSDGDHADGVRAGATADS